MEIEVLGKCDYMGVYLDVLQISGVWKHCKYIIFVLRASLSVFISFLSHLKEGWVLGANLLIELLCREVNEGLQSVKFTTSYFFLDISYLIPDVINIKTAL